MESRPEWISALEKGATLVTASDRLARYCREQYGDAMLAAGKSVWERPPILTWRAFWVQLQRPLAEHDPDWPILLSDAMERLIWERIVAPATADDGFLQVAGLAESAQQAWNLLQDYQLGLDELDAFAELPLRDFIHSFIRDTERAGQLSAARLPRRVLSKLDRVELPQQLLFVGFEEPTPLQLEAMEVLARHGCDVIKLPAGEARAQGSVVAALDIRDECRAAANWARTRLEQDPGQRLAIIASDLEARRDTLVRILREVLAPAKVATFSDSVDPFNISLALPLSEQSLVHDALTVLSLDQRRNEFPDVARLCRSPYLGSREERMSKLRLEHALRAGNHDVVSLSSWSQLAEGCVLPAFSGSIARLSGLLNALPARAAPAMWARHFSDCLETMQWCKARALTSDEYQARSAFHDLLDELSNCHAVAPAMTRAEALAIVRRLAHEKLFQPEAARVPVQVMGILESTGLEFDAAWVMGMDDTHLPTVAKPHPLIPKALQRKHDMPHSSAAREHRMAQRVVRRLRSLADEVIFSWPKQNDNSVLRLSPMLRDIQDIKNTEPGPDLAARWRKQAVMETLHDVQGAPLSDTNIRSGLRFIEDQINCAFRGHAVHRLDAHEWPTPNNDLEAITKGLVIHAALEKLWLRWRNRAGFVALSQEELQMQVTECVAEVVQAEERRTPQNWQKGLAALEIQRVTRLLLDWLETERQRPDFTVFDGERKVSIRAGKLAFNGRIDRIDRTADGRYLLIDYKTGRKAGKQIWKGEVLRSPQLPLYALNFPEPVDGFAQAHVRFGDNAFVGVASGDFAIAGIDDLAAARAKKESERDWPQWLESWKQQIETAADAIVSGDAAVNPLRGACDYCHLHGFCRVNESRLEAAAEEDIGATGNGYRDE